MTKEFVMLPREVLEQALNALEAGVKISPNSVLHDRLRAALEQPQGEQEPVAWCVMNGVSRYQLLKTKVVADALAAEMQKRHDLSGSIAAFHVKPAYPYLQPKHEPLTDEEIDKLCPQFDDPMRREMWIIGFKAAHNIK